MDHDYRPRSDYPAPQVISDTIGRGVQSMTNGQWYDSKSALRKEYKQAGVIEVGNDVPKHLGPKIDWKAEEVKRREAIKQAVAEVSSR